MSGGSLVCELQIGLGIRNWTHLFLLRYVSNLALHCGEVFLWAFVSPIMFQKVEAVVTTFTEAAFFDSFHLLYKVKVTVVVFSKATVVNVLDLSRDVLCHLQQLFNVEARR